MKLLNLRVRIDLKLWRMLKKVLSKTEQSY